MSDNYVPCRIAQLPPETWVEAARRAILSNPLNAPARPPALASMAPLSPLHLAALTGKAWPTSGVRATVQFLDGPDAETRRKILEAANAWNRTANVQFVETRGRGDVRVARTPGQGYYSYLGQDILHVPASECTMNLDSFTARTPDSEYKRVVPHEFGHTLSWPHEHTREGIVGRIDPQKADAYFLRYDGWDAETVRQQVLTPLDDALLTALPEDVRSVMCYGLPSEIMKDHVAVPGGTDINDEDFALAAKMYPKSDTGGGGGGGGPTPVPGGPTEAEVQSAVDARFTAWVRSNRRYSMILQAVGTDVDRTIRAVFAGRGHAPFNVPADAAGGAGG